MNIKEKINYYIYFHNLVSIIIINFFFYIIIYFNIY